MQHIAQTTTIWSFQRRLTYRLMLWSAPSVLLGTLLALRGRTAWQRAFGQQCAAWGAIDAAIALGGQHAAERKQQSAMPVDEHAQARSLRALLWLNTGLDVLYVLGGARLARAAQSESTRGHGAGIVLQGAFLLIFDLIHALAVPRFDSTAASAVSAEPDAGPSMQERPMQERPMQERPMQERPMQEREEKQP